MKKRKRNFTNPAIYHPNSRSRLFSKSLPERLHSITQRSTTKEQRTRFSTRNKRPKNHLKLKQPKRHLKQLQIIVYSLKVASGRT